KVNTFKSKELDLKGIAWFIAIAYGLAWLLDLPMYLDGKGLGSPWSALILLKNFTPAIATFIVTRRVSPLPHIRAATGLRRGVKGTRWGWRGYLLPQLLPLGQWRALLISGVIWGFWHAPISLLGGTYPLHPVLGILMYVLVGMIFGTILGWMRLAT